MEAGYLLENVRLCESHFQREAPNIIYHAVQIALFAALLSVSPCIHSCNTELDIHEHDIFKMNMHLWALGLA